MKFYQREIYHVYNRGNIRQKIFFEKRNYPFFLKKMESHLLPYCDMLAWCLMPNHFHWLIQVKDKDSLEPTVLAQDESVMALNKNIGILLRSYTRAINKVNNNRGSLFQQGTKAKNVNRGPTLRDNYALICFLYIHQNPVKANLATHFDHWEYSSYHEYTGQNCYKSICNTRLTRELFDLPSSVDVFREFSNLTLPDGFQDDIF